MSFAVKMLEMLTSSYNRTDIQNLQEKQLPQTNIGKLFSLAGWGFDIIKDQAEKVRLWDDIDVMQGSALTRYGESFGVSRGETSDEILRIMIKVKTIAMLASGDLDTIILSAATLFGVAATDVKADEIYPAKVYLYIDEDKLDAEHKRVAEIIAGLMSRIKASGVGIRIFYQTYFGGAENLYIMSMRSNHIKITASPDATNKKVRMDAGINVALPRLEHLQITYGAS